MSRYGLPEQPVRIKPTARTDFAEERLPKELSPLMRAEIAVVRGHAKNLSRYFREALSPDRNVVNAIARCLLGAGSNNQQLRFTTRNGRPPLITRFDLTIDERSAILCFDIGDEQPLGLYLSRGPISDRVRLLLADALDENGTTKWKLVFGRPRRGNPDSPLRTEIKMMALGQYALTLYKDLKRWGEVDQRLHDEGLSTGDNTMRIRAVRAYRNARRATKKPLE